VAAAGGLDVCAFIPRDLFFFLCALAS